MENPDGLLVVDRRRWGDFPCR